MLHIHLLEGRKKTNLAQNLLFTLFFLSLAHSGADPFLEATVEAVIKIRTSSAPDEAAKSTDELAVLLSRDGR